MSVTKAITMQDLRYAHSEGHTSLCYDDTGSHILTCGTDGDVRVWKGIDDDDAKSFSVGENALAVVAKNDRIFVATDTSSIQMLTMPDFYPDGIATVFTAPVTHMAVTKDGNTLVAGSCDFTIRVVEIATSQHREIKGHEAPILCVALDPLEEFIASSSCDGSVKIWKLSDLSCVKTWPISPKSNDFGLSPTLCRVSWQTKTGKYLAVPFEKEIQVYERNSWELIATLRDEIVNLLSVTAFSPCGSLLCAASVDGSVFVWNFLERKCVERIKHDKKVSITALAWNPEKKGEIALCDQQGHLCVLNGIPGNDSSTMLTEAEIMAEFADQFSAMDESDDEENTFSISRIKAETVGLEEESNSESIKPQKPSDTDTLSYNDLIDESKKGEREDSDNETVSNAPTPIKNNVIRPLSTPLQSAFQPGSTPVNLRHRFMMWNTVGIIHGYNTEEENTIDIEFHDTAVHHALHVANMFNYTMATLSTEAVLLAAVSQDDVQSKLTCMHFSSWDNNKEWSLFMPEGEEIQGVALGQGWAAIATNLRNLRLFSLGGTQLEVLTLPGSLVSMAGHLDYLIVAYHLGTGIPGDQCLGIMVLNVLARKLIISSSSPLPLSPKTTLAWLGFTDEGTPTYMDSAGIVRLLSRKYTATWHQVANTKALIKGKSSHHFVVGLSEIQQTIRAIPCKGSRYPVTLPRPIVTILPMQLPLCELSTEKGQFEESFWRNRMLEETLNHVDAEGFEVDIAAKEAATKMQREALLKLFALACRVDREFRATEIAELMASSHAVQLAIKYASRLKHNQLAQRLGETAYRKMNEESNRERIADSLEEAQQRVEYQRTASPDLFVSRSAPSPPPSYRHHLKKPVRRRSVDLDNDECASDQDANDSQQNDIDSRPETPEMSDERIKDGGRLHSTPLTAEAKNPFKVNSEKRQSLISNKGTELFDSMKKMDVNQKKGKEKSIAKEKATKSKTSKQLTLNGKTSGEKGTKVPVKSKAKKNAGFAVYFKSVQEDLQEENPNLDEAGLLKLANKNYEDFTDEEKEVWNSKSECSEPAKRGRKRKEQNTSNEENEINEDVDKKANNTLSAKKSKAGETKGKAKPIAGLTNSKLSNFIFRK